MFLLRLLFGIVKGAIVGAAVWAALHFGLHVESLGGTLLYAMVTAAGALTGLVAGKPIWQSGAKIEAGLKAFVGALVAPAALWAALKWAPIPSFAKIDEGYASWIVGAFTVLVAMLFELDNTPEETKGGRTEKQAPKLRAGSRPKIAEDLDDAEMEEAAASRRAKR